MSNIEDFEIPEEVVDRLKDPEVLRQYVSEGKTFQEILEYSDDMMEKFYQGAYSLFQKKQYQDAAEAFVFLTTLNPYVYNFWLGLGMAEQMNEEYEAALVAYGMATMTDLDNPLAHFHSANCYYLMGDLDTAITVMDVVLERCGTSERHKELKTMAEEAKERFKSKQ